MGIQDLPIDVQTKNERTGCNTYMPNEGSRYYRRWPRRMLKNCGRPQFRPHTTVSVRTAASWRIGDSRSVADTVIGKRQALADRKLSREGPRIARPDEKKNRENDAHSREDKKEPTVGPKKELEASQRNGSTGRTSNDQV